MLVPGAALSIIGMATLSLTRSGTAVLLGSAVFGAGFGILQNATLTLMYARVTTAAYSTVSAIWNAAYDVGMAIGAGGVGLVAAFAGYPAAFLLTATVMLPALLLAGREARPRAGHQRALSPAHRTRRTSRGPTDRDVETREPAPTHP